MTECTREAVNLWPFFWITVVICVTIVGLKNDWFRRSGSVNRE